MGKKGAALRFSAGDAHSRINPSDVRRFKATVQDLADLITRVRQYEPQAMFYVSGFTFSLLVGELRDGEEAHPERMACSVVLPHTTVDTWFRERARSEAGE